MTDSERKIIDLRTRGEYVSTGLEPQPIQPEPAPVNEALVANLEALLFDAKRGVIDSFTAVATYAECGDVSIVWTPPTEDSEDILNWMPRMTGHIEVMKGQFVMAQIQASGFFDQTFEDLSS